MTIEIFNDDCFNQMKKLPSGSIDIFICDLPYGQTACKWDNLIDLGALWDEFKRLRKSKHTPFFFFCTTRFGYDLITSNKKWFRYDIVIEKSNIVGYLNGKKMPKRKHEMIYVFYEKLPVYNWEKNHIKEAVKNKVLKNKEKDVYGKNEDNPSYIEYKFTPPLPISIQKMNNSNMRIKNHPTEKTTDILEWILKYYSNEGDTCLDPCMGSGSTGVACKNLNRNFIGIEKEIKYYEIAKNRLF